MSVINITEKNYRELISRPDTTLLLDFWASWCTPCQMLSPAIEQIASRHKDVIVGRVNVDEEHELTKLLGVIFVPSLVIMKSGKIISCETGLKHAEEIAAMLEG